MITFKLKSQDGCNNIFAAYEDDIIIGECFFILDKYSVNITDIKCDDISIEEGLIRSSLNYAANRNAYIASVNAGLDQFLFEKLGFAGQSVLTAEIPEVLSHGCSCGQ